MSSNDPINKEPAVPESGIDIDKIKRETDAINQIAEILYSLPRDSIRRILMLFADADRNERRA